MGVEIFDLSNWYKMILTWLHDGDSEPPGDLGQEDAIGEQEAVKDDLDQEHHQEEHQAPATLRVIMLEDARNAPLPVHTGIGHHTVLSLLTPRGQLSSSSDVTSWERHL